MWEEHRFLPLKISKKHVPRSVGTRLATTLKWYVYRYICEELISIAGHSLRGAIYISRKKAPTVRIEYTGGEWKDIIRLVKEKSQNSIFILSCQD